MVIGTPVPAKSKEALSGVQASWLLPLNQTAPPGGPPLLPLAPLVQVRAAPLVEVRLLEKPLASEMLVPAPSLEGSQKTKPGMAA